jgi:hypothetical protein
MSSVTNRNLLRLFGLAAIVLGGVGCATGTQSLQTSHYTLTHPDFWKVKKTAAQDGDSTILVIPQYGAAVIDEGSGSMANKGQNYDAVTADVEVRIYNFPFPNADADPSEAAAKLISKVDPELAIQQSLVIPDNPPECEVYPKKYTIFGKVQTPLDLVKRPGYRTIVVGGLADGFLTGVVARFEYEPDMGRNCHNLANMRVQLQNLLDALVATAPPGSVAPPGASAAAPPPPPAGGSTPPPAGGSTPPPAGGSTPPAAGGEAAPKP